MTVSIKETLDRVTTHLLTQAEKSAIQFKTRTGFSCRYRIVKSEKTLSCAVGCLIPDDQYTFSLEGKRVRAVISHVAALVDHNLSLMVELQTVHDSHPVEDWPALLANLYNTRKLPYPPILFEVLNRKPRTDQQGELEL